MDLTYYANGCVASPELLVALRADKGPWARAVLGQGFAMPDHTIRAVLSGEVECQIPTNGKSITITPGASL